MEVDKKELELKESVININRVCKVVKGGKKFSFSALVVVGDGAGHVGVALGKANEVQMAIIKAVNSAKKNMFPVVLKGTTIPHEIIGKFGAGKVLLKPALPGTGVVAGGVVRSILDAVGVRNILTKCLGSRNFFNLLYATVAALKELRSVEQAHELRFSDEVKN